MVEGSCDATTKQYSVLIDKQPIVCADGLMMKCCIIDNSYVPQEMIGYDDFIGSVKRAIDIAKTPDCSPVSNYNLTKCFQLFAYTLIYKKLLIRNLHVDGRNI